MFLSHIFFIPYHHETFIKTKLFLGNNAEVSGTVRALIVRSVLPGKVIIGGKISPHTALIRTTVTCVFLQPDVRTVTDLEPFFAKDWVPYPRKLAFHPCYPRVLEDVFRSLKFSSQFLFQLFRELLVN